MGSINKTWIGRKKAVEIYIQKNGEESNTTKINYYAYKKNK